MLKIFSIDPDWRERLSGTITRMPERKTSIVDGPHGAWYGDVAVSSLPEALPRHSPEGDDESPSQQPDAPSPRATKLFQLLRIGQARAANQLIEEQGIDDADLLFVLERMIQLRHHWGVLFAADKLALRCPPDVLLRAGDVAFEAGLFIYAQLYYRRAIELTEDPDQAREIARQLNERGRRTDESSSQQPDAPSPRATQLIQLIHSEGATGAANQFIKEALVS